MLLPAFQTLRIETYLTGSIGALIGGARLSPKTPLFAAYLALVESLLKIDQKDKAKQFEGKQVKVNGSLDKASSTIHITDIQPVPEK